MPAGSELNARMLPAATAVLAAVPVLVLVVLAAAGAASLWPALIGMAVVVVSAGIHAWLWLRDARIVGRTLEGDAGARALLPPMVPLADGAGRLARGLAEERARFARLHGADAAILDCLPDPLIVLGADRGILRASRAAKALFGDAIPAVLRMPALRGAVDRALAQGAPQVVDIALPVPVSRDVQATVAPLDPPLRDGGRILLVLSDRTRERVVERMRADFVANASHELRTPLASLTGFIETLRGPASDDPQAQARFLGIMAEQAERMRRLIDDLLSLSRIELSEHQAPEEEVDLGAIVARVVAGFEPVVAARKVRLEVSVAPGLPKIRGDADQLAQVMQNLIDNAIKYGREAGVVRVEVAPAEADQDWPARPGVVVSVSDDGPGIPREHIPRLTERFYRVDKGRSRAVGGTGLGLAIVKHIVNRHRGRLRIASGEGRGARFSVWLAV